MSDDIKQESTNDSYDFVLSADKSYVKANEEVEITLTLSSTIPYEIYNISAMIAIGIDAVFKEGSVTIDGVSYPDFDIQTGFKIPKNLEVGGDPIVVKYTLIIEQDAYDPIFNRGSITFSILDVHDTGGTTNNLELSVVNQNISITQSVNKTAVISGQTLTYTSKILNDGNMTHSNVVFNDVLSSQLSFVNGSVKVNGISYPDANPNTGFTIPDLSIDEYVIVKFDAIVN